VINVIAEPVSLGQKLRQDIATSRSHRLANADLARNKVNAGRARQRTADCDAILPSSRRRDRAQ
jgi:hypothetical protein